MKRKALFMVAAVALVMAACSTDSGKALGPKKPVITDLLSLQSNQYPQGAAAVPLTVTATTRDKKAKLSYQWYSNTENSNKKGAKIAGATEADYTPSTETIGEFYYYVEVVSTLNKEKAKATSDVAAITVVDPAEMPQVNTSNGKEGEVESGEDILLNVKLPDSIEELLESNEDYEVLYQWYDNGPRNSNVGGTAIAGAAESSYMPVKTDPGTTYYYAVITVKDKVTGEVVKILTTSPQKVTVIVNTQIIDRSKENARLPTIATQPDVSLKGYFIGVTADPLTVEARVSDGGVLTYQWYRNPEGIDEDGFPIGAGERISGATKTSYTPPTDVLGTTSYYVVVTNEIEDNQDGGVKTARRTSQVVEVEVKKGIDVQAPTITVHPVSALYEQNDDATALFVTATSPDGGTLLYQWYKKLEDNNISGEPIEGATNSSYKPPTAQKGLLYYFCEVTNKLADNGDGGTKTASVRSSPAYIGVEVTPLNLTGVTVLSKAYDGTKTAEYTGGTISGYGADDVTLQKGTAEFAQADVGTDIAVTLIGWYLAGTKAPNYVLIIPTTLVANITKAAGAAVNKPEVTGITTSFKITVAEVTLADSATDLQKAQQTVEYAKGANDTTAAESLTWQDERVFTGLTALADYYIYARSKSSGNYNAGATNVSGVITTVGGSPVSGAPEFVSKASDRITVSAVTPTEAEKGQEVEYAIGTSSILNPTLNPTTLTWQSSPAFTGLKAAVEYFVYARSKANENYAAGTHQVSAQIITDKPLVTFATNGGSPLAAVTINKGSKLPVPDPILRTSYTFDAWYADEGLTTPYDFNDTVTDNLTIYAGWVPTPLVQANASKDLVLIHGGVFTMGSPTGESGRSTNETQHTVKLKGFFMGKYEVTQELWQEIMETNPSYFHGGTGREPADGEIQGKRPVEMVNWYQALVFCNKLSIRAQFTPAYRIKGSVYPVDWGDVPVNNSSNADWNAVQIVEGSTGYRLPTEAQWEYACRAGTTTAYNTGASISDDTGWYTDNSEVNGTKRTHMVGLKPSAGNAWGLYDMHGNVGEWVWDRCNPDARFSSVAAYGTATQINPAGPASGNANRLIRGGSYYHEAANLRSAYRYNDLGPQSCSLRIGLRLMRPL